MTTPASTRPASPARSTGSPGDPGGATLEQQLAKLLYAPGGPAAKLTGIAVALKLDAAYSKPQILEMYASAVYFGHGFYGVDAAACGYFAVPPARLDWAQATLLAGLMQPPAPTTRCRTRPPRWPASTTCSPACAAGGTLTAAQAAAISRGPLRLRAPGATPGCS